MTAPREPTRLKLAQTPTPLMPLPRMSERLGVELLAKRDDLTGCTLSGNKIRKLEYLLADALAEGADTVLTCGGQQSNHCRATALACAQLDLSCVLLLRTDNPRSPPSTTGNILLDKLAGAEVVWVSHADYARRHELCQEHCQRLRSKGRKPYMIAEGGSSPLGCWGYVRGGRELANDLDKLPAKQTSVVYACGSGGTGAGLVLARALGALPTRIVGVNVCNDREYFVTIIHQLCRDFAERYASQTQVLTEDIEILDGYVGRGYAKSRPAELTHLVELARSEAMVLDPVYTGKAWHGMLEELAQHPHHFGERIVFLHTGGIFGALAAQTEIAAVL